jgi:hypothetical protein
MSGRKLTAAEVEALCSAPTSEGAPKLTWSQVQAQQTKPPARTHAKPSADPAQSPAAAQMRLPSVAPTGRDKKRQGNAAEEAFVQGCDMAGVPVRRIPESARIVATLTHDHARAYRLPLPKDPKARPYRVARLERACAVDFMGHLPSAKGSPLPLYAEVKSVEVHDHASAGRWVPDERILLPTAPGMPPALGHQGRELERAASDGCAALIFLVRLSGTDPGTQTLPPRAIPSALYLLPWPAANPRTQTPPRESWRWEDLEGWRVPVGVCWWEALRSAEAWTAYKAHGWKKEPAP